MFHDFSIKPLAVSSKLMENFYHYHQNRKCSALASSIVGIEKVLSVSSKPVLKAICAVYLQHSLLYNGNKQIGRGDSSWQAIYQTM